MTIERKVAVRVEFGTGAGNLGPALDRYKSQVQDLSRLTSAWQRQMQQVPVLPVGPWLKAQEALKEQALRSTFGRGPEVEKASSRLFREFEQWEKPKVDPMMDLLKPRMQMGALGTMPPGWTEQVAKEKKAADDFRLSIEQLERSLKKQRDTAGMTPNQMRIWELERDARKHGMKPEEVERLRGLQEAADFAIETDRNKKTKGFWSPKRIFAGGGFAMLGLAAQGAGGNWGQMLSGASTGAGVAVALGATSPGGMAAGAAIGGALTAIGLVKGTVESLIPTFDQFNAAMDKIGDSVRRSTDAMDRMERGEMPGDDILGGATRARVATARAFGGEEAALDEVRRERARLGALGVEGEGARVLDIFSVARSAFSAPREEIVGEGLAASREHAARLRYLDEVLARGGAAGFTRPEIPMARGSGGIESIGIELSRAILEHGGPMERTATATEGMWEILRAGAAAGGVAGAPAPAMP